ncbi:hypothetical protein SAMN04488072_10224 [Lentibacillus halodurans]|uniref:RsgI N-terminal anti-sigma domain-containing protein n=1 Tax=Lentibacillus halodurans TaxID=237679 RepID=A0A1I0VWF9_9BACI|nr:anti-sigma factor domain-containing protein [Lentibacillus halodurans]SFA80775.1 hypothetical protein SAMN04488072_10224 [Lentibacillus halodurans]
MKKGIVMEKHRNYIIVMRKDGAFQKAIPLDNAAVGMEVSYQPINGKHRPLSHYITGKKYFWFQATAFACILLLLIPIYFMMDGDETYAYVNITINPSLELEIDDHLKVQSIAPLNEDAEQLLHQMTDYEGNQLEYVIEQIITESEEAKLLQNGKNMLIGVSYMPETHEVSVTNVIDQYFLDTDWAVTAFQVPSKIRKQAHENKQSMNELMATNLIESETASDKEVEHEAESPVDDEDREIIHSFYNDHDNHSGSASEKEEADISEDKEPSDETGAYKNDQTEQSAKPASQNETTDPSELKAENGKKNGHENQNASIHNNTDHEEEDHDHGKVKGHDKSQHHSGKAKESNEKAKGHEKAKENNGKAKGHQQGNSEKGHPGHNGKGPK